MKRIVAVIVAALALTVILSPAYASRVDPPASPVVISMWFNQTKGVSLDGVAWYSPGPMVNLIASETVVFQLNSNDNYTHVFLIDMDNSGAVSVGDYISLPFSRTTTTSMTIIVNWTGLRLYIDQSNPSRNFGALSSSTPAPSPPTPPPSNNTTAPASPTISFGWFRMDPFFIFGFLMILALIGYCIWLLNNLRKWLKLRKKTTDRQAVKWANAVMDPDTPARMSQAFVDDYNQKLLVKKLKRLKPRRYKDPEKKRWWKK